MMPGDRFKSFGGLIIAMLLSFLILSELNFYMNWNVEARRVVSLPVKNVEF